MKYMKPIVKKKLKNEYFFGMLRQKGMYFSVFRKGKSYLPNRCTFQFELGIPCTNTSGP